MARKVSCDSAHLHGSRYHPPKASSHFSRGRAATHLLCARAAASVVFTMLYVGAVEGTGEWAGPKQIVRMNDAQATLREDLDRKAYAVESLKPGFEPNGKTWYLENSREQIRTKQSARGSYQTTQRLNVRGLQRPPRFHVMRSEGNSSCALRPVHISRRAGESHRDMARTASLRRGARTDSPDAPGRNDDR